MMRRAEREVKERSQLQEILEKAEICRLAFASDGVPYVVPLNFGFKWEDDLTLYFHSARGGKKIECLEKNNYVCFETEADCQLKKGEKPCDWGMRYKSLIGWGHLFEVEEDKEKIKGLDLIMEHYGFDGPKDYDPKLLEQMVILKLKVEKLSGKMVR